jgi:hypothetical protein
MGNTKKKYHVMNMHQLLLGIFLVFLLLPFLRIQISALNICDDPEVAQTLSNKTSVPHSGQNLKKTHPRGIPAQEPGSIHTSFTGQFLNYPGDDFTFIYSPPFLQRFTIQRAGIKVRPPPAQAFKDRLTA